MSESYMRNTDIIDKSKCEIIPCQLSIRDFSKNPSEKSEMESWEYETILKQRMDWDEFTWTKIEDKEDNDELIDILNIPKTGEICQNEFIIDKDQLKVSAMYSLNELAHEIQTNSFPLTDDKVKMTLKYAKSSKRKTVLNYYPVDVEQNRFFLDMDRRVFPYIFEEGDNVSKTVKGLPLGFHSISNGETRNMTCLNTNISDSGSSDIGRLFFYETSEQHSPFQMHQLLTSILISYSCDFRNVQSPLGILRRIKRKSPFFGNISDKIPYQLALENPFFRVPVYEHKMKSTDFLLSLNGENEFSIRKFDGILLAGKQMPLVKIHNPNSNFFRRMMMKVVIQLFLDMGVVPVDVLASVLSNVDFLNLEREIQKIASLNKDKKNLRLKVPVNENDGFYVDLQVEDYMVWLSIISYLSNYEFVQPDKKQKKLYKTETKKKYRKNPFSPWSISKSYLNGIHKGFWKLENFEEPTRRNQMDSFTFVNRLVPKRMINEKTDLRKLTVHEANRLLKKFRVIDNSKKKMKRWALVNHLSTHAATDLGGNVDMEKYARETKANRRNIRLKYIQQCQTAFESNRAILTNPEEPESEVECSEEILKAESKDINILKDIEDFKKYLEESNNKFNKPRVLPLLSCNETVKQLLEKPLKHFILYRKKDDVVKKEIYPVNEYVLNYLKYAKKWKFGRKLYGIGDVAMKEKQQMRYKLYRQEKYKKKRMDLNLPLDENCQDTTDKVCSNCGKKGHNRSNQECPNYGKFSELMVGHSKSVSSKPKLLKQESSERKSPILKTIVNQKPKVPSKDKSFHHNEKVLPNKRPKLLLSNNNDRQKLVASPPCEDDDDEDESFIINIPVNHKVKNTKPVKTAKSKKQRQRKRPATKKLQFSACAPPFGDEPVIFQTQDVFPNCSQPTILTSDDESYMIELDPKLWDNVKKSRFVETDMSFSVPNDDANQESEDGCNEVSDTSREKENIFENFDHRIGNNGADEIDDDDDDDDFIIDFSEFIYSTYLK